MTEINIKGTEMLKLEVKPMGNSGHIYVPKHWIGKKVAVVLMEDE